MTEIEKLMENAGIKPEYRYDCNLADTIKPIEVFPLRSCSKGEIKDYCTNKQYYRYCKVYKVNKIYPPFTEHKQLELIKWLAKKFLFFAIEIDSKSWSCSTGIISGFYKKSLEESLADYINSIWQDLTEEEQKQIKEILND